MMIEKLVQYTHLEKLYGYLPGMDEALLARLFGLDLEEYREMKVRFDVNALDAAAELLEEPGFAERVDRLPFRSGETVLGHLGSIVENFNTRCRLFIAVIDYMHTQRETARNIG
jgi:hypothetical protein